MAFGINAGRDELNLWWSWNKTVPRCRSHSSKSYKHVEQLPFLCIVAQEFMATYKLNTFTSQQFMKLRYSHATVFLSNRNRPVPKRTYSRYHSPASIHWHNIP